MSSRIFTATLEALREPLETRQISLRRGAIGTTYPCAFQLVAAMNPCPCGFLEIQKRSASALDVSCIATKNFLAQFWTALILKCLYLGWPMKNGARRLEQLLLNSGPKLLQHVKRQLARFCGAFQNNQEMKCGLG